MWVESHRRSMGTGLRRALPPTRVPGSRLLVSRAGRTTAVLCCPGPGRGVRAHPTHAAPGPGTSQPPRCVSCRERGDRGASSETGTVGTSGSAPWHAAPAGPRQRPRPRCCGARRPLDSSVQAPRQVGLERAATRCRGSGDQQQTPEVPGGERGRGGQKEGQPLDPRAHE